MTWRSTDIQRKNVTFLHDLHLLTSHRALVPPIMRCQEDVTSVCHDQTGLMETVDSKQFDLDVVCGDSEF